MHFGFSLSPPIQLALHDHWKRRMGALITLAGALPADNCDAYDATDAQVDMTNGWGYDIFSKKVGLPQGELLS